MCRQAEEKARKGAASGGHHRGGVRSVRYSLCKRCGGRGKRVSGGEGEGRGDGEERKKS